MTAPAIREIKVIPLRKVPSVSYEAPQKVQACFPGKLPVPTGHRIDLIDIYEIVFCKACSNYTEIHLSDGRKMLLSKTLKSIESMLHGYACFSRPHKSYLVNLCFVTALDKSGAWHLEVVGGMRLPVSRSGKAQFVAMMSVNG
jgi:two-component system LytT family response regulator